MTKEVFCTPVHNMHIQKHAYIQYNSKSVIDSDPLSMEDLLIFLCDLKEVKKSPLVEFHLQASTFDLSICL